MGGDYIPEQRKALLSPNIKTLARKTFTTKLGIIHKKYQYMRLSLIPLPAKDCQKLPGIQA